MHGLETELAGLKPIVVDIHNSMPRITRALETLAKVTAQQQANHEDHKRIHFRIAENTKEIESIEKDVKELRGEFRNLQQEHIECRAERSALGRIKRKSGWDKIKDQAQQTTVNWLVLLLLAFLLFVFVPKAMEFVATLPTVKSALGSGYDKDNKND